MSFAASFIDTVVERCLDRLSCREQLSPPGQTWLDFETEASDGSAGFLQLWAADDPVDRVVRVQLQGTGSEIHLFFVFGRSDTLVPHFHLQIVQIGDASCVYNVDLLPRLDPVDHPGYYEQVFFPLNRAYWKATTNPDNACASAPANPAIAAYLSPWGIAAGRPTDVAELERVGVQIHEYLAHFLDLTRGIDYPAPAPELLRERNRRHLSCFFDEKLDPRAWKGLYRLAGGDQGHQIRQILMQELA